MVSPKFQKAATSGTQRMEYNLTRQSLGYHEMLDMTILWFRQFRQSLLSLSVEWAVAVVVRPGTICSLAC